MQSQQISDLAYNVVSLILLEWVEGVQLITPHMKSVCFQEQPCQNLVSIVSGYEMYLQYVEGIQINPISAFQIPKF